MKKKLPVVTENRVPTKIPQPTWSTYDQGHYLTLEPKPGYDNYLDIRYDEINGWAWIDGSGVTRHGFSSAWAAMVDYRQNLMQWTSAVMHSPPPKDDRQWPKKRSR